MSLKGKTALVTGGSRGIGNAIVLELLAQGAAVFGASRKEPDNAPALAAAARESGGAFTWRRTDVTVESEVAALVEGVAGAAGRIDILVNNAGITRDGLIFRMPTADWDDVLRTNLSSAFYACRAAARLMIKQRSGSIVNVASVVGIVGNAGQTNYAASKAGLIGFTKSLAREVASRGVRVNAVAPGFIDTDMTKALGDKAREQLLSQIPLGRMGTPADVAALVAFLAGDGSAYITGHVIPVDGGMAM